MLLVNSVILSLALRAKANHIVKTAMVTAAVRLLTRAKETPKADIKAIEKVTRDAEKYQHVKGNLLTAKNPGETGADYCISIFTVSKKWRGIAG